VQRNRLLFLYEPLQVDPVKLVLMEEKKAHFVIERDVLGQDINPVFIQTERVREKEEKIDHSKSFELPSIKTRYISMLIDVLLIILISLGIAELLDNRIEIPGYVRGILFLIVVILYEPILISFACTFGQLLMSIRVRRFRKPNERIWVVNAIFRSITKATLGWLSFITVTFNINRRAIHDYLSGSIVIIKKDLKPISN